MSTNDVPGSNPANQDSLHTGCWAEHKDGSYIFVEGNEANLVVFSMFDTAKDPVVEYRERMAEATFKRMFSWPGSTDKWTWHDKTPFPWDKIITKGASDGQKYASAHDQISAAERVAESLKSKGAEIAPDAFKKIRKLGSKLARALEQLGA